MLFLRVCCVCLFLTPVLALSQPQTIDFETFPDGSSVTEGMLIHDQYSAWGVTFELEGMPSDMGPKVAAVGGVRTAFTGIDRWEPNCNVDLPTTNDMPAASQGVGCLFLTDDNLVIQESFTLRVNYLTPVFQASGELLDIDVLEAWTVEALDINDQIIFTEEFASGDPGTGNGIATQWSVSLAQPIHAIRLVPNTASGGNLFGLAFDNFSPTSVPEFPVCDAGGPYATAEAGVPVQFIGENSYDTDGEVVGWLWDFGDGTTSDEMNPVHTYAEAGEYDILLCVTDNNGNQSCCSPEFPPVATEAASWSRVKAIFR